MTGDRASTERPAALHPVRSSLFARIFALVLATVVVAQIINLALLALLPPAPTRSLPVSALVAEVLAPGPDGLFDHAAVRAPLANDAGDGPAAGLIAADLANVPNTRWQLTK